MMYNYTPKDIVNSLREIGVNKADHVFLHSNLGFFGMLEGCKSADNMCEAFISALKEVIGDNGAIITPTFSYSYCHGEVYNPYTTKTTCGMLAEYMIKHFPENRTLDPNFSVCGIGKGYNEYLDCNIHESFGADCFWERLLKSQGKIICMNFDAGSTFVHYIERCNNVEYRHNKAFNGTTEFHEKIIQDYAVHFVFEREEDGPCMERVDELCREKKICRQTNLGRGTVLAFEVQEYYSYFTELLKARPRVLCKVENV